MKIYLLIFISFISYGQDYFPISNGEIISHKYLTISYNEEHEQAEWVHYKVGEFDLNNSLIRIDKFKSDNKVSTKSSNDSDYLNSKYERGHLAPFMDMKINKTSVLESFLFSNISPQKKSFNSGIWLSLEKLIRKWAKTNFIYVTTAGVLEDDLIKIGPNSVSVPKRFYKIVYDSIKQRMIAFLISTDKPFNSLQSYVISVDDIEKLTGIDFYSQLDDDLESKLESESSFSKWIFF